MDSFVFLKNISKLESMVNQIKKNSKDIQAFLDEIENIDLFQRPEPYPDGTLFQCKVTLIWLLMISI